MNVPVTRKTAHRRQRPRGFSLIELGIVIAVIAVLASVVIFGRGFIAAGRITKAVEGMNTIRKSASTFAGLQGGALVASTGNVELTRLSLRQLLPPLVVPGQWTVSGDSAAGTVDSVRITDLRFGQIVPVGTTTPVNAVMIRVEAPGVMVQDVWTSVAQDTNLILTGPTIGGGAACMTPATGPTNPNQFVTICFTL